MECLKMIECYKNQNKMSHCYFQNSQMCQSKTRYKRISHLSVRGHYKPNSIWADLIYCNGSTVLNVSIGTSIINNNAIETTNLLTVVLYGTEKAASIQPCLYTPKIRKRLTVATAYNYANKFIVDYNKQPTFHTDFPVTLCTQLDVRRLPSLVKMAQNYKGTISAAIFIQNPIIQTRIIQKFIMNSSEVFKKIKLHLVFGITGHPFVRDPWARRKNGFIYPINILRNVAIKEATTKYILYLEGDMILPAHTQQLLKEETNYMNQIKRPHSNVINALILPLFYPSGECKEKPMPRSKIDLQMMPYRGCAYESHQFMNYETWLLLPANKTVFKLPKYVSILGTNRDGELIKGFEPYFVVARKDAPSFYNQVYCFGDKVYPIIDWISNNVVNFYLSPNVFLLNIECTSRINVATKKISLCPEYTKSPRKWLQIEYARFLSRHSVGKVRRIGGNNYKTVILSFVTNKKVIGIEMVFLLLCMVVQIIVKFTPLANKSRVICRRTMKKVY